MKLNCLSGPGLSLWARGPNDSSPLPAADATAAPTSTTTTATATAPRPPPQLLTQMPEILQHPLHNIEHWRQSLQSRNSAPQNATSNAPQILAHAAVATAVTTMVTVNPAVEYLVKKFAGLHGHREETRNGLCKSHPLSLSSPNVLTGPWEEESGNLGIGFAPSRWSLLDPPCLRSQETQDCCRYWAWISSLATPTLAKDLWGSYVIGLLTRKWW